MIAVAEGFAEAAQKAKIFQLKVERKAGGWLSTHIRPGRPSEDNGRIKLDDLDLSYNDSSRWQLMATVPEDKFLSWLDEKLMKGHEVTAGGLRMYARNLSGKPYRSGSISGRYLLNPSGCALAGYAIGCDGPPTGGHIINKSKTRNSPKARAILIAQAEKWAIHGTAEIMTTQCHAHNVSRLADEPQAVRIMLLQKVYEYGYSHMHRWFYEFLSAFKLWPTELELERLLDR